MKLYTKKTIIIFIAVFLFITIFSGLYIYKTLKSQGDFCVTAEGHKIYNGDSLMYPDFEGFNGPGRSGKIEICEAGNVRVVKDGPAGQTPVWADKKFNVYGRKINFCQKMIICNSKSQERIAINGPFICNHVGCEPECNFEKSDYRECYQN